MSEATARPCWFLSHSGADTDAARRSNAGSWIAQRRAPLAFATGWIETTLRPAWARKFSLRSHQRGATAFAVHVGAKGVVNWVENEVRLGLSRAAGVPDYPFIPILSRECSGTTALPPLKTVSRRGRSLNDARIRSFCALCCTERLARGRSRRYPFVGLKAMNEADADRFFGRNDESSSLSPS